MPRGDQTGPNGQGSMTGRGLGSCRPGTRNSRFLGFGRGRGFSRVNTDFRSTSTLEEEKEYLQSRLDDVNKQLKE